MIHTPPDPSRSEAPAKLAGLQAGRAVAALMVVLFHANVYLLPVTLYDGATAGRVFNFGYAGVEFFFVLSGFIMMLVHRRDVGQPAQVGRFLRKRILRIYPLYWLVMAALIGLYVLTPLDGSDQLRDAGMLLASFALWPMPDPPMMQVAWTLQHEMAFYLVFALILLHRTFGGAIFAGWMVACVVACVVVLPTQEPLGYPLDFLLKPHNLLFLFGILAAIVHRRVSQTTARTALWAGTTAFLALGLGETLYGLPPGPAALTLGYGAAAALIVVGLARGDLPTAPWVTVLGDASYAIYLVHLPALKLVAVALNLVGAPAVLPPLAALILVVTAAIAIGTAVHLLLEKPLLRALTSPLRAKATA